MIRFGRSWFSTMFRRAVSCSVIGDPSRREGRGRGLIATHKGRRNRVRRRGPVDPALGTPLIDERRPGGRVVMQRTANPCTSVRFRPGPPTSQGGGIPEGALV